MIVTAGMPRATNGACSYALNGNPRSTSCRSALARPGSVPVSAAIWARTVSTRPDAGVSAVSPASSSRGCPVPGDGVEVDHGDDVLTLGRMGGERGRAEPAVCAAVGGEEEQGVRQAELGRAAGRRIGACELDECGRAGGVVVRARADAGVVAVGEHDDRLVREASLLDDEVEQAHPALGGDRGGERLRLDRVAVRRQLLGEPAGRSVGRRRSGNPAWVAERELARRARGRRCGRRQAADSAAAAPQDARR